MSFYKRIFLFIAVISVGCESIQAEGLVELAEGVSKLSLETAPDVQADAGVASQKPSKEAKKLTDSFENLSVQPVPQPYHLCRRAKQKAVVQYGHTVDGIALPSEFSKVSVGHVARLSLNDGYKSHVLAGAFVKIEKKSKLALFTTASGFPGFEAPDKPLVLDWASAGSRSKTDSVCKKCSCSQGGHSEPQLVEDFNAKMTQDSGSVVKFYTDHLQKDETLSQCGLVMYGSFDMCDDCIGVLLAFQKEAAEQTGIVAALRNNLKDRLKSDSFQLIYHSRWPYKGGRYAVKRGEEIINVEYSYGVKPKRHDRFSVSNLFDADSTLIPHNPSIVSSDGVIYAHTHLLTERSEALTSEMGCHYFHF